jgi:molybdopterin synthase sulfur carrier subunit
MTKVEIRLYAGLRRYHPDGQSSDAFTMELGDRATLSDVIDRLKIPRQEVSVLMVNGKWEKEDYPLKEGDRIGLFPLIGGG